MTGLKSWLSLEENHKEIPPNQFNSILNELDSARVSVKGGEVFSVTYSLVANVQVHVSFQLR